MPKINFTSALQRHVTCPPERVAGGTVREVLEGVFDGNPRLRGYVLDEHGALRKHVVVFVGGQQIADRARQSDAVPPEAEVYVMQALSGG